MVGIDLKSSTRKLLVPSGFLATRADLPLAYGERLTAEQIDHSEQGVSERSADLRPRVLLLDARPVDQAEHTVQEPIISLLLLESAFGIVRVVRIAALSEEGSVRYHAELSFAEL